MTSSATGFRDAPTSPEDVEVLMRVRQHSLFINLINYNDTTPLRPYGKLSSLPQNCRVRHESFKGLPLHPHLQERIALPPPHR